MPKFLFRCHTDINTLVVFFKEKEKHGIDLVWTQFGHMVDLLNVRLHLVAMLRRVWFAVKYMASLWFGSNL